MRYIFAKDFMNQDRKDQEIEFEPVQGTNITLENPRLAAERGAALREARISLRISELKVETAQTETSTSSSNTQEVGNQNRIIDQVESLFQPESVNVGQVEDSITWLMTVGKRASLKRAA